MGQNTLIGFVQSNKLGDNISGDMYIKLCDYSDNLCLTASNYDEFIDLIIVKTLYTITNSSYYYIIITASDKQLISILYLNMLSVLYDMNRLHSATNKEIITSNYSKVIFALPDVLMLQNSEYVNMVIACNLKENDKEYVEKFKERYKPTAVQYYGVSV